MIRGIHICLASLIIVSPVLAGETSPPPPPKGEPTAAPQARSSGVAPASAAQPGAPSLQGPPGVQDMTNSSYLTDLAQVHIRYGALDRAEPLLRTALEKAKTPSETQASRSALALLLQRKGDTKGAAELYQAAIAATTDPNERARLKLAMVESYRNAGQMELAEKLLTELVQSRADTGAADQWLRQEAERTLLQLWKSQPAKLDTAIRDTEAAVAKDPKDAGALERLAEMYSTGRPDPAKAAECYEKLCGLRPDDRSAQRKAAMFCQQTKQYDKAIVAYRRLMAGAPTKDEAQQCAFMVGQLLQQAEKKDEAIAWMKSNFAKEGAGSRDLVMLATFYEQAGMAADAEAALFQAESATQSGPEKADCRLRRGELAIRQKDYAKAEELIRAVLKDFADNAAISSRANLALKRLETVKGGGAAGKQ